jgi:hypothetical protein
MAADGCTEIARDVLTPFGLNRSAESLGATIAMRYKHAMRMLLVSLIAAQVVCVVGCASTRGEGWAQRLRDKQRLELQHRPERDPRWRFKPRPFIPIKTDVQRYIVSLPMQPFADAFHATMRDTTRQFGEIRVLRLPENACCEFKLGEHFQGKYGLCPICGKLDKPWLDAIVIAIEDSMTSDYGEIDELRLTGPPGQPRVLRYVYLQGSPIAGSSTFEVTPINACYSMLTQTFVWQEQDASFEEFFRREGLKLHNEVVREQTRQSAETGGGSIVWIDEDAHEQQTDPSKLGPCPPPPPLCQDGCVPGAAPATTP